MAKDWNLVDGAWYYFGTDGIMKTGVINISGNIFYSDAQGKMVVNTWENIGQRWFFFGGNGIMVSNTTLAIKGVTYQFDASGVMVAPAGITPVQ